MPRYIQFIDGARGGFMPAPHRLRIAVVQSDASSPATLHVETPGGSRHEPHVAVCDRADIPASAASALFAAVAGQLAGLPVEDPAGADDVYATDLALSVVLDAGSADAALAWHGGVFAAREVSAEARSGIDAASMTGTWMNHVPGGCAYAENEGVAPTEDQMAAFRAAAAAVVKFARAHGGGDAVPVPAKLAALV
ncbi:hypothetical protein H9P43_009815 [Blastocladiella emersonii ATCC 22665]|nr:hypothetical protein H9P43_009815 [Blastocladiella emersonii ATCC 22665]